MSIIIIMSIIYGGNLWKKLKLHGEWNEFKTFDFNGITECFIAPSTSNDPLCGKTESSRDELILYGAVENRVGAPVRLLRKWGADLRGQSNLPTLETGMLSIILPIFNRNPACKCPSHFIRLFSDKPTVGYSLRNEKCFDFTESNMECHWC